MSLPLPNAPGESPASTRIFRLSKPRGKYLLIVNKGPGAVHIPREENRNWDLMEIYFKPADIERVSADPAATDAEHIVFETDRQRRKFAIVKAVFDANDFWHGYDAIMMADDDVEPVGCTMSEIFDFFMTTGCRVGQPALTQDSYFAWFLTVKNDNFAWRRTNHIDFMCIIMTPAAFDDYLPIFDANISSFGFDLYWGYHEWRHGLGHAVLDRTPMRHGRPVGTGVAYQGLGDPMKECAEFLARHNIPRYTPLCLDGVPAAAPSDDSLRLALALSGYGKKIMNDPRYQQYAITEIARLIQQKD